MKDESAALVNLLLMKDEGVAVRHSTHFLSALTSSFILPPSSLPFYAFSSPAYFSTSFFWPKPGKLTRSLAASPTPSRRSTRPRPYFGCLTCVPGTKPLPEEEDDDEGDAEERPPPAGRAGGVGAGCCCW